LRRSKIKPGRAGIEREGSLWVHRGDSETVEAEKQVSNEERIVRALGDARLAFGQLQERSGVPEGSFGRVLRRLVEAGTIAKSDTYYHLPCDSDSEGDSDDSGGVVLQMEPVLPIGNELVIPIPRREKSGGSGLVAVSYDGSTEPWETKQRRKGWSI
jgi:hypothetical protein